MTGGQTPCQVLRFYDRGMTGGQTPCQVSERYSDRGTDPLSGFDERMAEKDN